MSPAVGEFDKDGLAWVAPASWLAGARARSTTARFSSPLASTPQGWNALADKVPPSTSPLNGTAVVATGRERDAIYDKVVAKYGFMTKVTTLPGQGRWVRQAQEAAVCRPRRGRHALGVIAVVSSVLAT